MTCGQALQIDLASESTNISAAKRFHVPREQVQDLLRRNQCTKEELLQSMVSACSTLARPPISQFNVGAVGMTPKNDIYIGVNLEFLHVPLNNSVHAEQFLIANLRLHKETELEFVAVNAAPCGHCRQFYSELWCADKVKFLFPTSEATATVKNTPRQLHSYHLEQLLPMRFKPQDLLGSNPPPLMLQPQQHRLIWTQKARAELARHADNETFQAAASVALAEACESYAPYSKCPAGVALITQKGDVHGGGYLESAAFNPSMQALQVAVVDAVIHHMPCCTHVKEVVVVECENLHVQHGPMIQFLLNAIAPDAVVTNLHVKAA
jgi:cytidine deaminase